MATAINVLGLLLVTAVFGMLFWRRRRGAPDDRGNPAGEGMPGAWQAGDQYTRGGGSAGPD